MKDRDKAVSIYGISHSFTYLAFTTRASYGETMLLASVDAGGYSQARVGSGVAPGQRAGEIPGYRLAESNHKLTIHHLVGLHGHEIRVSKSLG